MPLFGKSGGAPSSGVGVCIYGNSVDYSIAAAQQFVWWDLKIYDPWLCVQTPTGALSSWQFQAKMRGVYMFQASVSRQNGAEGWMDWQLNGIGNGMRTAQGIVQGALTDVHWPGSSNWLTMFVTPTLLLEGGDIVRFSTRYSANTANTVSGWMYFMANWFPELQVDA